MRILFSSGVDVGGAPSSTIELARRLSERGHRVGVILGSGRPGGWLHQNLHKAAIKLRMSLGWTWPRALVRPFGRVGPPPIEEAGIVIWRRPNAANALRPLIRSFRPDVIIANSHLREHLRWMLADARREGIPLALYMREEHSISHLLISRLDLDLVLANSMHLAEEAAAAGYECHFIPSIIDLSALTVDSSREAVTLINPVPENRPQIMRALAIRRPDVQVVLQESWPLDADWQAELKSWTSQCPNLIFRSRTADPREIYRDARLLVAPYPSGRPRVVLEAQHNAIPVVALAQPALVEAVGDGGVFVALETGIDGWVDTIVNTLNDTAAYARLSSQALKHAQREEIAPEAIAGRFEEALAILASRSG